ncbi:MAG: 4-phosphoerythronate dehydrogenase [Pseudomonadales bacterium]|nr:4-phosphoerythronate dehydrogenase [Pseudomonadales bacterium]
MKIVADENITGLRHLFAPHAELLMLPGRAITEEVLHDADVLLVRSVTRVGASLLAHSPVKFVGTATSGTDHIDQDYLCDAGIAFADAAGCNANSVVEYVIAALSHLSLSKNFSWLEKTLGIVGAGHIGGLLAARLEKLNMDYVIHDPLLDPAGRHAARLVSFEQASAQDILTLHTPLTYDTEFPTFHMLDAGVINNLCGGQVVINAARGGVIDGNALKARLRKKNDLLTVIDAWENEPEPDPGLLKLVTIGTPHIAGYSYDGKLKGSLLLYEKFCRHFGLEYRDPGFYGVEDLVLDLHDEVGLHGEELMDRAIRGAYDIGADHASLSAIGANRASGVAGGLFEGLRKNYRKRYEFYHFRPILPAHEKNLAQLLRNLGFQ